MMHAVVKAGQHPGVYSIPTAKITGADPKLREEEIVFSCHLDHPRPGANDNASGCVTILEIGRTLAKLIAEGKIARPARTIRFVWPPEIEGTMVLLNAKPDWAKRIKATIHMDMVGGGPETKAVFHVTRGPTSLPSFIYDVAEAFGEFVNEQSYEFAATGRAAYPLVAPEGSKEPLLAQMAAFSMGSDHEVYMEGSWRIPSIYLNDWPDRYIHTNFDVAANIDPTKLKRAAFIGAASGYFLAQITSQDAGAILNVMKPRTLHRAALWLERGASVSEWQENQDLVELHRHERELFDSFRHFYVPPDEVAKDGEKFLRRVLEMTGIPLPGYGPVPVGADLVFVRNRDVKGPMRVFGYDFLAERLGEEKTRSLKLLQHQSLRGSGGEYAYEVLNFVDGKRSVREVRDAVAAEFGPVEIVYVLEYLRALESIGVVQQVRKDEIRK